ncbi:MAG: hypothetical protein ACI9MC_003192 [Kiritimatiellia bacterium]|jgi:hypothetical protein
MTEVLVELLAMAVYGNIIVLLHELGHAGFARFAGFRVTSFAVGLGPPLLRFPLRDGVVFHIDRWPIGGACTAIPLGPTGAGRSWYHAGGLVVQGVLGVFLFALPEHWLIDRMMHFNALVALTNAVPWKLGGSASDGWYLLDAWRGGRRAVEILPQRAQLERLAAREQAVGSPLGTLYADLCLAWADVLAGRADRASKFFELDPPQTAVEPWIDVLYHYVRAEWHRQLHRPLAALRTLQDTRRARESEVGEMGLDLLLVAEARTLIDLGDNQKAQRVLAKLAGTWGPVGRQASAIQLRTSIEDAAEELEYATWRVARRVNEAWLDPADTIETLHIAADRLEEHGRPAPAAGARQAANTLSKRILASCAAEDRPSLNARLGTIDATTTERGQSGAVR